MKAIPVSVRKEAVDAYLAGRGTVDEIAAEFGMNPGSLSRYLRAVRQGDGLEPKPHPAHGRHRMGEEEERVIVAFLTAHPHATLEDLRRHVVRETGVQASRKTYDRTLLRLEIHREKRSAKEQPANDAPRRYGYGPRHRREGLKLLYPSSLTDVEWDLVRDLFEHAGPGRPPVHGRRVMLDAIFYVVRSGCPWRMLPKDFPKWQTVYAQFRHWAEQGCFEAMHDRLRSLWRERIGRACQPTAALVDSQSVKTAEKGGPSGTTRVRRSRVASATS
jgi:transposase